MADGGAQLPVTARATAQPLVRSHWHEQLGFKDGALVGERGQLPLCLNF